MKESWVERFLAGALFLLALTVLVIMAAMVFSLFYNPALLMDCTTTTTQNGEVTTTVRTCTT